MNNTVFSNISKIIERDSKSTTYKFALLRGVIDIILDNSPFISFSNDRVSIPTGLLIEKWMMYYYPILESDTYIPQINGETNLAFEVQFKKIILAYKGNNGFSAFYNDLKNKGIPKDLQPAFLELSRKLSETITKMPMKYIGRSLSNDYYSIFQFEPGKRKGKAGNIDIEFLISSFGTFSIPVEYYEAFKFLGSFISGQDSILFKWAEFSVNASGGNLSIDKVVKEVLRSPISERDMRESDKVFRDKLSKEGKILCVWTGKAITSYDIDHVIPFSVWKNNDLWNLLPSQSTTNNQKRDKIPSADLIEKRKDLIIQYWELLHANRPQRFQKEIQVALLGNNPFSNWHKSAINQLQSSCNYLISNRGYEAWNI